MEKHADVPRLPGNWDPIRDEVDHVFQHSDVDLLADGDRLAIAYEAYDRLEAAHPDLVGTAELAEAVARETGVSIVIADIAAYTRRG